MNNTDYQLLIAMIRQFLIPEENENIKLDIHFRMPSLNIWALMINIYKKDSFIYIDEGGITFKQYYNKPEKYEIIEKTGFKIKRNDQGEEVIFRKINVFEEFLEANIAQTIIRLINLVEIIINEDIPFNFEEA